jgi:hypothetical protein
MSWEQLLSIGYENAALVAEWEAAPPIACPRCGWPLSAAPDGQLFCPNGDWKDETLGPAEIN